MSAGRSRRGLGGLIVGLDLEHRRTAADRREDGGVEHRGGREQVERAGRGVEVHDGAVGIDDQVGVAGVFHRHRSDGARRAEREATVGRGEHQHTRIARNRLRKGQASQHVRRSPGLRDEDAVQHRRITRGRHRRGPGQAEVAGAPEPPALVQGRDQAIQVVDVRDTALRGHVQRQRVDDDGGRALTAEGLDDLRRLPGDGVLVGDVPADRRDAVRARGGTLAADLADDEERTGLRLVQPSRPQLEILEPVIARDARHQALLHPAQLGSRKHVGRHRQAILARSAGTLLLPHAHQVSHMRRRARHQREHRSVLRGADRVEPAIVDDGVGVERSGEGDSQGEQERNDAHGRPRLAMTFEHRDASSGGSLLFMRQSRGDWRAKLSQHGSERRARSSPGVAAQGEGFLPR